MFTDEVSFRRVGVAQGYSVLKSGRGTGAPPAFGGVAWARAVWEDAGLSACEEEAPRTWVGSCACEEGFRADGGGFGVIFVRVMIATAKEEERKNNQGVTEADSVMEGR